VLPGHGAKVVERGKGRKRKKEGGGSGKEPVGVAQFIICMGKRGWGDGWVGGCVEGVGGLAIGEVRSVDRERLHGGVSGGGGARDGG